MSGGRGGRGGDGPEVAEITAVDALLDALGHGADAPPDDPLAGVLAAWRAELDEDLPGDVEIPSDLDDVPAQAPPVPVAPVRSVRRGRWRPGPLARRVVAGIAAAALLVMGLAVAADHAGPRSPLWPVAQVLYPEQSDARLAEHHIALARHAARAGRYDDARRWLDRATTSVDRIHDRELAQRLRAEIDALRQELSRPAGPTPPADPGGSGDPGGAAESGPPAGGTPTPTPTPGEDAPGGEPGGGQPGGGPGGGEPGGGPGGTPTQPGGIIPGLPPINPPSLPVPLPPLPSLPGVPPIPPLG